MAKDARITVKIAPKAKRILKDKKLINFVNIAEFFYSPTLSCRLFYLSEFAMIYSILGFNQIKTTATEPIL